MVVIDGTAVLIMLILAFTVGWVVTRATHLRHAKGLEALVQQIYEYTLINRDVDATAQYIATEIEQYRRNPKQEIQ